MISLNKRSYNNFTHWAHEYMRRPPFSGLLEDTVLLKLASPCPEAAYLYDLSWEKESVFFTLKACSLSKVNDRLNFINRINSFINPSWIRKLFSNFCFDALSLYVTGLNMVLEEGGDPKDGKKLVQKLLGRSYHSAMGYRSKT